MSVCGTKMSYVVVMVIFCLIRPPWHFLKAKDTKQDESASIIPSRHKMTCMQVREVFSRLKINQYFVGKDNANKAMLAILKDISENVEVSMKCLLTTVYYNDNNPLRQNVLPHKRSTGHFIEQPTDITHAYSGDDGIPMVKRFEHRYHSKEDEGRYRRMIYATYCSRHWLGDGLCDLGCNSQDNNYDDGDCCYESCVMKARFYSCGIVGYQCISSNNLIPIWFVNHTRICFRYEADGDAGQCGETGKGTVCAAVGAMTSFYFDNTDKRTGGCQLAWMLSSPQSPKWFRSSKICYRFRSEVNNGQCGNKRLSSGIRCAFVNNWTPVYHDNTDERPGGCFLSWKLSIPNEITTLPVWIQKLRLCFYWFSDNNDGQCGTNGKQNICAVANTWTPYFRDNTNEREGGCHLAWSIVFE